MAEPKAVDVRVTEAAEPLDVNVVSSPAPTTSPLNRAPRTTAEQDRKSRGQRQVNAVWEVTQATIALVVVLTTSAGILAARIIGNDEVGAFPPEWWTILGLVIGFYFGRTNHARIGDEAGATPFSKDDPM